MKSKILNALMEINSLYQQGLISKKEKSSASMVLQEKLKNNGNAEINEAAFSEEVLKIINKINF